MIPDINVPDPGLGFPLNAVLGGIGSAVGGLFQNAANRKMAREQMSFQERMSSTAYQRAVKDMRLAGLNPMLAYQQGGASSPGGASATMADVVGAGTHSARAGLEQRMQLKLMALQGAKTSADMSLANAQTQSEEERKALIRAQKFMTVTQMQALRAQFPKLGVQSSVWSRIGDGLESLLGMEDDRPAQFAAGLREGLRYAPEWMRKLAERYLKNSARR